MKEPEDITPAPAPGLKKSHHAASDFVKPHAYNALSLIGASEHYLRLEAGKTAGVALSIMLLNNFGDRK